MGGGNRVEHDGARFTDLTIDSAKLRLDKKLTAAAAGAVDMDAAVEVVMDYLEWKGYAEEGP